MAKATEERFNDLHGLVVETLIEQIAIYTRAVDEDGKPNPQPVPPALLGQAIKMLKDNGIDSPARAKKLLDTLSAAMPKFDDHDHEGARH